MKLRTDKLKLKKYGIDKKEELEFGMHEFTVIKEFIYKHAGIDISEGKLYFLKKRVLQRVKAKEMDSVEEYMKYLKFFDKEKKEMNDLINAVTINETYFFREFNQLQAFGECCIEDVLIKNKGKKNIKILSAGTSSGEEPYTLAIIINEILEGEDIEFEIIGIDIDDNMLEKAQKGIYGLRSVKRVPPRYLEKYFDKVGLDEEEYKIKSFIKEKIKFRKVNLSDKEELLRIGRNFDFIFCRNVLIYFDQESKKRVIENYYKMMNYDGYIFLGHSESLFRITTAFKLKKMGGQLVYQKSKEV